MASKKAILQFSCECGRSYNLICDAAAGRTSSLGEEPMAELTIEVKCGADEHIAAAIVDIELPSPDEPPQTPRECFNETVKVTLDLPHSALRQIIHEATVSYLRSKETLSPKDDTEPPTSPPPPLSPVGRDGIAPTEVASGSDAAE